MARKRPDRGSLALPFVEAEYAQGTDGSLRVGDEHEALLPELLRDLSGDVGVAAAMALVRWRGGVSVYVPRKPGKHHPIVQQLGQEVAEWLAQHYGGEYVAVPRAAAALRAVQHREMQRRFAEGASARELALSFGVTERHVWRIVGGEYDH